MYIFILNFSLPPRSEQVNGAVANEIKHVHSPEVIVVLYPRYDLSYKVLYISTCSIALIKQFMTANSLHSIHQWHICFLGREFEPLEKQHRNYLSVGSISLVTFVEPYFIILMSVRLERI